MRRGGLRFCHSVSLLLPSCFHRGEQYSSGAMYVFFLLFGADADTQRDSARNDSTLLIIKGHPGLKMCWYILYPAPS